MIRVRGVARQVRRLVRRFAVRAGLVEPWVPVKPDYRRSADELPWLDRPDALVKLEQARSGGLVSEQEFRWLQQWVRDGFFVIEGGFPPELLDQVNRDAESVWTARKAVRGIAVGPVWLVADGPPVNLSHEELLKFPVEERQKLRTQRNCRIYQLHQASRSVRRIEEDSRLSRLASLLLGRPTPCEFLMYLERGSTSTTHQDGAGLFLYPPGMALGVWVACEDVHEDAGPFFYLPGMYREPMFPGFADQYPEVSLKNCSKQTLDEYNLWIKEVEARYSRRQLLARKGDIMVFHTMLLHGGEELRNPELTRRSVVMFFVPPGVKQDRFVKGPFNF